MNFFISLLIILLNFLITLFVFLKKPKSPINISYLWFGLAVTCWVLAFSCSFYGKNTLFLTRATIFFGTFIPISFVIFCREFQEQKRITKIELIAYLGPLLLLLSALPTDYLISSAKLTAGGLLFTYGYLYSVGGAYLILGILYPLLNLLFFYRKADQRKQIQILLILVGAILGTLIGYFFSFALPAMGFVFYNKFSIIGSLLFLLFIAYAITKEKLFDISVIIKKTTTYIITTSLVILTFACGYYYAKEYGSAETLGIVMALGIFWSFAAYPFEEWLITTARRAFVKGWYNQESLFNELSKKLSGETDRLTLFRTIEKIMDDHINFEQIGSLVAVRDGEGNLTEYILHYTKEDNQVRTQTFQLSDPVIMTFNQSTEIQSLLELDIITKSQFKSLGFDEKSFFIPFRSPELLEGVLVLGRRSSQMAFKPADFEFFNTIINLVSAILYRLTPFEKIENKYFNTQKKLHDAELQIYRSKDTESITHYHTQFAHEVKTPLSIIKMTTNEIPNTPDLKPLKESILEEIEKASLIISETLRLAESSRKLQRNEEMIDINEALDRCFKLLSTSKEITLKKDLQPNLPLTLGVFRDIQMLFTNLMKNAIEAMPNGGVISVRTYTKNDNIMIEFSDTGVGISPERKAKIWKPYIAGEQTESAGNTKTNSPGWGLTIINRIINEHAGFIDFTSEVGKGTTFTIRLPIQH